MNIPTPIPTPMTIKGRPAPATASSSSENSYKKMKVDSPSSASSSSTPLSSSHSGSNTTVYKRWTVPMTNELSRLLLKYKAHRIDASNSFTNTGFREIQAELKESFADQYEINKFEIKKMREKLKQINNEILGFKKFLASESDIKWCIAEGKLYLKDISKLDTLKKNASSSVYPGLSWNSIRRYLAGGCHYIYLHSTQFFIDNRKDAHDNSISLVDLFGDLSLNKAFRPAPLETILTVIQELVQSDDYSIDNDDIISENIGIYSSNNSSSSSVTTTSITTKTINGASSKVKRYKNSSSSSSPTSKRQKKSAELPPNPTDNEILIQPHQYYPNYYINSNNNNQFDSFYPSTVVKGSPSPNIRNLLHNSADTQQQLINSPTSSPSHSHNTNQNAATERNAGSTGTNKKSSFSMLAAVLNKPLTSATAIVPAGNNIGNTSNSRSSSTSSTTSSSSSMNSAHNSRSGSSSSAVRLGPAISATGNTISNGVTSTGPTTATANITVPGSVNMNIVSPFNPGNIPNLYDPFSSRSLRGSLNSQPSTSQPPLQQQQQQQQQQQSSSSSSSHGLLQHHRNSSATTSSRRSLTFLDSLWNFHGSGSGSASGGSGSGGIGIGSGGSFFLPNPNHSYTASPTLPPAGGNGSLSGIGSMITSNPLNIASPPLNSATIENNNINGSNKGSVVSTSGSSSSVTPRNSTTSLSSSQQQQATNASTSSAVAINNSGSISGASSHRSNSNPDLLLLPDPSSSSVTSSPHHHHHHGHNLLHHHLLSSSSASTSTVSGGSGSTSKSGRATGVPAVAAVVAGNDLKRASSPSILPPLASTSSSASKTATTSSSNTSRSVAISSNSNAHKARSHSHNHHNRPGNASTAGNTSPASNSSSNLHPTHDSAATTSTVSSTATACSTGNTGKYTSTDPTEIHNHNDDVTIAASTLNDISAASQASSFTGSTDDKSDTLNNATTALASNSSNGGSNVPMAIAHALGNSSGPINTFNGVPLHFISPFSNNSKNSNSSSNSGTGVTTSHHSNSRNHHNGVVDINEIGSKLPVSPTAAGQNDQNEATSTGILGSENNREMNSLLVVLYNRRKNIEEANDYLRKLRSLAIINSKTFIELGELISTNDSLLYYIINKDIVFEEKVNFIKDLVLNQ